MGGFFILRVIICLLLSTPPPQRATGVLLSHSLPQLLSCDWISSKQTGPVAAARTSFLHATSDTQSLSPERLFF